MTQNHDAKSAPTKSRALADWVAEIASLSTPDQIVWCNGSEAERHRLTDLAVKSGTLIPLSPKKKPESYLHRSNPNDVARTEQLTFICTPDKDRRRPDQQLGRPRRDLRQAARMARRLDARAHDVRRAVRDGADRIAVREGRRRDDGQHLRRAQHGDHDPDGLGGARDAGRLRRLQPRPPLHARSSIPSAASSAISRRTTRFGRSAAATAATRCSARNASRCASRAGSARREGWLAEHMLILGLQNPQRRDHLCRRGVSERMRQDQPRDAHAAARLRAAGRSSPSATISHGCASGPTGGYGRSILRTDISASRRAPTRIRIRTR